MFTIADVMNDKTARNATPAVKARDLCAIARDIRQYWPNPYFGAVPYLQAMARLGSIQDNFGCDSARDIVNYFLANATTWKGDHARRIKAELKGILRAR